MADKIKVNRLTNANVYMDGGSQLGKIEEMNLPTIKHKYAEHKALGMVASMEFWSGIEKMEAKIKWNAIYPDAMAKIADPTTAIQLQLRGSLEEYTSAGRTSQVPAVVFMTVMPKDFAGGNYKQHDNVEAETNLGVYYFRMEINGRPIVEIDVLANVFKANGVDILARYRQNIGA